MMRKVGMAAVVVLWMSAGSLWAQEKIVVGGSGALRPDMEELAKAYLAKHPSDSIEILEQSMSTTGGIEGTKAGRLTIGMVTRPLRDDEKERLVYRAVGRVPVGIGVHRSIPVNSLTESQVCDIFSGKIKSWREVGGSDGKITVLTRKRDDAGIEALRDKMACLRNLSFSRDAVVLMRGNEVVEALDRRPGTIAITSFVVAALKDYPNIKAVAINGVAPVPDAVQSGKYKYFHELGVVTLGEPQGLAKRLLDFVGGSEGQKVLVARGVIPAR